MAIIHINNIRIVVVLVGDGRKQVLKELDQLFHTDENLVISKLQEL